MSDEQEESTQILDTIYILSMVSVVVGFAATWVLVKIMDRYCNAEIDEEYIAMMLARFEEGEADRNNIKTIFKHMTVDERRSVLEKVLMIKPFSKQDVIDELSMRKQAALLTKLEEGGDSTVHQIISEASNVSDHTKEKDQNNDQEENEEKNDKQVQETSSSWISNLFTPKKEENDETNGAKEEISLDKCSICLEAYDDGTDITIGQTCPHVYHTKCLMQWMCAKHDFCPICREYLFDVRKFKQIAEDQLTKERFDEIVEKDDPILVAMYMEYFDQQQPEEEVVNHEEDVQNSNDEGFNETSTVRVDT